MDDSVQKTQSPPSPLDTKEELAHITEEMYKKNFELAEKNKTLSLLRKIDEIILGSVTDVTQIAQQVINITAEDAGFKASALYLVSKKEGVLTRIAASQAKLFKDVMLKLNLDLFPSSIFVNQEDNSIAKCVREKTKQIIHELFPLLHPYLHDEEIKRIAEKKEVTSSVVYPLIIRDEPIGVFVICLGEDEVILLPEQRELMERLVGVIGIAIDNALLYQNIQEANRRLKELDQLKNEFVSVASHELRTPMTAIKSYLWMALAGKGGELNERQKYYLQRSYNSVDRLIKLVNDMLNISRIESGRLSVEMKEIDLPKLIQEVIEDVAPRAEQLGLSVTLQIASPISTVIADPDKIKEVVFNLIGNSLKFTDRGGKISVSLSQVADMIVVKITDTGIGIEAEDLPKLFQKFGLLPGSYVTNQPSMGTGLGLFICKSIIELHQGKIEVKSEGRGKGSEFSFTLKVFSQDALQQFNELYAKHEKEKIGLIHTQF